MGILISIVCAVIVFLIGLNWTINPQNFSRGRVAIWRYLFVIFLSFLPESVSNFIVRILGLAMIVLSFVTVFSTVQQYGKSDESNEYAERFEVIASLSPDGKVESEKPLTPEQQEGIETVVMGRAEKMLSDAQVAWAQNKCEDAVRMAEEAYQMCNNALGPEHQKTKEVGQKLEASRKALMQLKPASAVAPVTANAQ